MAAVLVFLQIAENAKTERIYEKSNSNFAYLIGKEVHIPYVAQP